MTEQRIYTPLGFLVLMRAIGRTRLPYPLERYTDFGTKPAYDAAWQAEAVALRDSYDDFTDAAVKILAAPEARVEMTGYAEGEKLRTYATVRGRTAVLVEQQRVPTDQPGGKIRMLMVPAGHLAAHIVDRLPTCSPARAEEFTFAREDLDNEAEQFNIWNADRRTPRDKANDFFARPRTTLVAMATHSGPATADRPTPARYLHVMDYQEGRYLVTDHRGRVTATPGSTDTAQQHLDRMIYHSVEYHRELAEYR